jgi:AraC-like DNA-binding protein
MQFDFNLYSTPLLFGFVQGWVYAVLFWIRAWRRERLSDVLFGGLLAALTFEIWEYMLGFAGIEILWTTLEFLPRTLGFLLPPLAYFYLKSQFNTDFKFRWADLRHAIPFGIFVLYRVSVYAQGPQFVEFWKEKYHFGGGITYVEMLVSVVQQVVYFVWMVRLYRAWLPSQFSNPDTVSFEWLRVVTWAFLGLQVVGWSMTLIDAWLDLDFWHDWWDELTTAIIIYFLGVAGMAQSQPRRLEFAPPEEPQQLTPKPEKIPDTDLLNYQNRLERLMRDERLYLDPDLSLGQLARRLDTNTSVLSAVVNRAFGKNFNDFVNEYRVEAVKNLLGTPSAQHLSLLGIAFECGFNSKSTFNRAFRKVTGVAPSEWATSG